MRSFILFLLLVAGFFAWLFSGVGVGINFKEEQQGDGVYPLAVVAAVPRCVDCRLSKFYAVVYDRFLKPVSGAEVFVNGKSVGSTNRRGVIVCDLGKGFLPVKRVEAHLERRGVKYRGTLVFPSLTKTPSGETVEIFAYTDRGIYRPGEIVRVRVLGWRVGRQIKALAAAKIRVVLKDRSGRELWGQVIRTDDYGVAFCDLPLVKNMPRGDYLLEVGHKGVASLAWIKVERFRAPVIKVDTDVCEWITPQAKEFEIKVRAGYYSCMPLEGAQATIEILGPRQVRYRWKGAIDERRPLRLRISGGDLRRLLAGLRPDMDALTVRISVFDRFGRKDTVERLVQFTTNPYILDVRVPKRFFRVGEDFRLKIFVRDKLKRPVPFKSVFVRVNGREVVGVTDENGLASVRIRQERQHQTAEIFVEGVEGRVAAVTTHASEGGHPISAETVVKAEDGEPAVVLVRVGSRFLPLERRIHFVVVGPDGVIEEGGDVDLDGMADGWRAEIVVKPKFWGCGSVVSWCCAEDMRNGQKGLLVAGEFLDVDKRGKLTLLLSNVPKVARPGEALDMSVRVVDEHGNGADVALGASVVDSAALALLDPFRAKPEEVLYGTAKAMREAVWPLLQCNWSRDVLSNLALPPFGWHPTGLRITPFKRPYRVVRPAVVALDTESPRRARDFPRGTQFDNFSNRNLNAVGYVDDWGVGNEVMPRPTVKIHIRTNFAETALWAPHLNSKSGQFDIRFRLPDSVSQNRLTLVASDREGRVKTVSLNIRTSLDFFIRSDMPPVLVMGDEVEFGVVVSNRTGRDVCARIDLSADELDVIGHSRKRVLVPADGMAAVRFRVRAKRVGRFYYCLRAVAPGLSDGIRRYVDVLPPGQPDVTRFSRVVRDGRCKILFNLPLGDIKRVCLVSITYPGFQTVLQSVEAMACYPHG